MGTRVPTITILQHNLGKGKVATAELRTAAPVSRLSPSTSGTVGHTPHSR